MMLSHSSVAVAPPIFLKFLSKNAPAADLACTSNQYSMSSPLIRVEGVGADILTERAAHHLIASDADRQTRCEGGVRVNPVGLFFDHASMVVFLSFWDTPNQP